MPNNASVAGSGTEDGGGPSTLVGSFVNVNVAVMAARKRSMRLIAGKVLMDRNVPKAVRARRRPSGTASAIIRVERNVSIAAALSKNSPCSRASRKRRNRLRSRPSSARC